MKRFIIIILVALSWLPMAAQLNGTGYYRICNVASPDDYLSINNDLFSYNTVIVTAGGGGSAILDGAGKPRALECVGAYMKTDIHLVKDANCVNPATIVYLEKKSNGDKYNLTGQSTSLKEITDGTHTFSKWGITIPVEFKDNFATIKSVSGSGANTIYTAKVELKKTVIISVDLGTFYFIDDNGSFAISESSSESTVQWYIRPVTYFNVDASLEYKGKYYCTMYTPFAYTLDGQTEKAWVISGINADGTLQKTCIAANANVTDEASEVIGAAVPAGTPVILECSSNVPVDCQLKPQGEPYIDMSCDYTGTNLLKGAYFCNTDGNVPFTNSSNGTSYINANHYTSYNSSNMLVFGVSESPDDVNRLGFFPYTCDKMKSNKVWLEVSGGNANTNFTFEANEPSQKGVAYE